MEEKNEDSFFHIKENYEKLKKKISNFHLHNQSTEIIPTEDIFINQKEEIKKIKKRRLEIKVLRESYKEKTNLKYIQVKKENYSSYNTVASNASNKSANKNNKDNFKINKSNSSNNKIIKRKKKDKHYEKNIEIIKLKLFNNIKKNNFNKKNNIVIDNIDNDKIIINNDSENITIKNIDNEIDFISLSNTDYFEKCECQKKRIYNGDNDNENENDNDNDENNLPIINEKWKNLNDYLSKNNLLNISLNFDFNKKVLRTKNCIDYNIKGVEINIHLKLYGQSSFYIFTRCYIDDYDDTNNNTINNSEEIKKTKTENISHNNNKMFSKYSTVIRIFKNKNSKKAFSSFGTFYKSRKSGNIHYKTFLQRQLVDFFHYDKNYYYLENDLCEFDIIITDLGNENLETKISLNNKDNKERYNNIKSNFYLPINKKAKLMFCGEGNKVLVTDLKVRSFNKYDEGGERVGLLLSTEKKSCDCCLIL